MALSAIITGAIANHGAMLATAMGAVILAYIGPWALRKLAVKLGIIDGFKPQLYQLERVEAQKKLERRYKRAGM